jgi:hypothetical protein
MIELIIEVDNLLGNRDKESSENLCYGNPTESPGNQEVAGV